MAIFAAQAFDRAIRKQFAKVTCLVENSARFVAERVLQKRLGRFIRLVEIALRQRHATEVDLAGHVDRAKLETRVQDVDLEVADRCADRNVARRLRHIIGDVVGSSADGALGRPVGVDDQNVQPEAALPSANHFAEHRFARYEDALHRGELCVLLIGEIRCQLLEQDGRDRQRGRLCPFDRLRQFADRETLVG
ncbi:hypothetical protein CIG75_02705 [Tumebacillus algifaecis]|uniref:Uncharacterized protein n=1 Tax=Tumebacillus algifaecis TaxID=1214604 RepID=A0A223CXH4_9BACL|nr:hypothetical protein CIG75_02705 [Tumebacillus algifaecis]